MGNCASTPHDVGDRPHPRKLVASSPPGPSGDRVPSTARFAPIRSCGSTDSSQSRSFAGASDGPISPLREGGCPPSMVRRPKTKIISDYSTAPKGHPSPPDGVSRPSMATFVELSSDNNPVNPLVRHEVVRAPQSASTMSRHSIAETAEYHE